MSRGTSLPHPGRYEGGQFGGPLPEAFRRYNPLMRAVHWGAVLLAAGAVDLHIQNERSGTRLPSYHAAESLKAPTKPKSKFTLVSYNIKQDVMGHVDDLRAMDEAHDVDVFVLQEVTSAGARALPKEMPDYNQEFVYADGLQDQGVMILAKRRITDVDSELLSGTDLFQTVFGYVEGFGVAIAEAGKKVGKEVPDGRREKRAILSGVVEAHGPGHDTPITIITSHIGARGRYPGIHVAQLHKFVKYVKAKQDHGMPVIVAGDFNAEQPEVEDAFAGTGFTMLETGRTSVPDKRAIDHVGYYALTKGTAHVDRRWKSDHYPIIFNMDLP